MGRKEKELAKEQENQGKIDRFERQEEEVMRYLMKKGYSQDEIKEVIKDPDLQLDKYLSDRFLKDQEALSKKYKPISERLSLPFDKDSPADYLVHFDIEKDQISPAGKNQWKSLSEHFPIALQNLVQLSKLVDKKSNSGEMIGRASRKFYGEIKNRLEDLRQMLIPYSTDIIIKSLNSDNPYAMKTRYSPDLVKKWESDILALGDKAHENSGLESRALTVLIPSIAGIILSLLFFSFNLTGNTISNLSLKDGNILGIIFLLAGLFGFFFYIQRKRYPKRFNH